MKRVLALALALALLSGCAPRESDDGGLHILCTTYPVYLFTTAVTQGARGVEVELLVDQKISCLHDYTLTVEDMKAVEAADVIVENGAGLEAFLADALAQKDVPVIDCSEGLTLLPAPDHHNAPGEGEEEPDPHAWMDPRRAAAMVSTIAQGLSRLDPDNSRLYDLNDTLIYDQMGGTRQDMDPALFQVFTVTGQSTTDGLWACDKLITFHDGFQYFADAFGLDLLRSIEEEEGSEASAKELEELICLVREERIPAIFVEKNGSRRSADVIARETGCKVYELDMVMSGDGTGIGSYLEAIDHNLAVLREALG